MLSTNRHARRKLNAESRTRAGRKALAKEFMLQNCERIRENGIALKYLHSAERKRVEAARRTHKTRTKKAA